MVTEVGMNTGRGTFQSFRDPAGQVILSQDRVFRVVSPQAIDDLDRFLGSSLARQMLESGQLVGTSRVSTQELADLSATDQLVLAPEQATDRIVVEHERIPFPSYPYEWSPQMLHTAGTLTLDLAEKLLDQGMGIKDATPYNILFRGPVPVFVDLLSFETRTPGDPVWTAYAQFVRTFLLPLLVNRHFGISLNQLWLAKRDGLEPEDVYRLCGPLKKLSPAFLELVSLPNWLAGKQSRDDENLYQTRTLENEEKARFILKSLFSRLRRWHNKLKPRDEAESKWSDYLTAGHNYSADHFAAKQQFVTEVMQQYRPGQVLDVGCNTGHFSELAARNGASVVALDYDPVVVDRLWLKAATERLDILPLVVDLTRPSPGTGWRNQECQPFLARAGGGFAAVLMLAVIHHMLVTERIPLAEIMALAASLTRDLLIVEYVDPADSMFRRLVRGREALHNDLTPAAFEAACQRHFTIERVQHLADTSRWLYLLRKL